MTTLGQGPTPWFEFALPPGWRARAVEHEAMDTAMRWATADGSSSPRPAPSSRDESGIDFVCRAIQRSYL